MSSSTKLAALTAIESTMSQLAADEYSSDILQHMIRMDKETRPDPAMIDQQPEIGWHWWPVLINMMVDMHAKLGLEPQTLFLAVSIVNRYCAKRIVYQKHIRLVGVTAVWIASKYEDKKSVVPTLRLLRHLSNGNYSEDMFVMMEGHILSTLDWTVTHCGVDSFLRVLHSRHQGLSSPVFEHLCSYIAEITLYHKIFVGKDPLLIAQAIDALAYHLLNLPPHQHYENAEQWQHWVPTLADVILQPPQAIVEKYRSPERHSVTRVVDSWVLRRQRLAQAEAKAQAAAQSAHAAASLASRSPSSIRSVDSPTTPSDANPNMRVKILSHQSSSTSLPMTPPPSATRFGASKVNEHPPTYNLSAHQNTTGYMSELTPPSSVVLNQCGDHSIYGHPTPTKIHSLASLASYGSVTSLNSATSAPYGIMDSHSPPTTPMSAAAALNPPRPTFRV